MPKLSHLTTQCHWTTTPSTATTTTSTSTYNYHHHRPPPHSACCSTTRSGVCVPVGGRKKTISASCKGWHHHRCKECLRQWLKENATSASCRQWPPPCVQVEYLHWLIEGQHHKCKVQRSGCKVQRSGQKVQRSGPASVQVGKGCSNNIQLQPPPPLTSTMLQLLQLA